jgi:hypothetical protein
LKMTTKQDQQIEDLKREVAELRHAVRGVNHGSDAEIAAWREEMHRASEARMSRVQNFTAEQLREMDAACPPSAMQDIITKGAAPRPPSADGVSGQLTRAHPSPGLAGSHGWQNPRPLGPPPGVAAADRLMDAQDARDRHDLMVAEARRAAERKLAKGE